MTWFFLHLFLLCFALRAHAGSYFCSNSKIIRKEINHQSGAIDHLVIPWEYGEVNSSKIIHCKWVFTFNTKNSSILLLESFDAAKEARDRFKARRSSKFKQNRSVSRIWYRQTDGTGCSSAADQNWKRVEMRMLHIVQLPKRTSLIAQLDENSDVHRYDTPGLRIRLIERGFCSSETVNYNSNCYTTSLDRGTVKEQLTSMSRYGGLAQLASFNSANDLQSFVNESQRTLAGSGMQAQSKIPLNLTQPVRIGLFYQRLESSIYYLADSNGELVMKLLPDPHQLYHKINSTSSKVACGSLRIVRASADSFGHVDFGDCNELLPALLSFPDSAKNCCCNRSVRPVLEFIEKAPVTMKSVSDFPLISAEKNFEANFKERKLDENFANKFSVSEKCSVLYIVFILVLIFLLIALCATFALSILLRKVTRDFKFRFDPNSPVQKIRSNSSGFDRSTLKYLSSDPHHEASIEI